MRYFTLALALSLVAATAAAVDVEPKADTAEKAAESSQVVFLGPDGMGVQWDVDDDDEWDVSKQLTAPGRHNFRQGAVHQLRFWNISGRPEVGLRATLEISASNPATEAFLKQNAIPVEFRMDDFDRALNGKAVTQVMYLPKPEFKELALAGVDSVVSTLLAAGDDPVAEATKRGATLATVRLAPSDAKTPAPRTVNQAKGSAGDKIQIFAPYKPGEPDKDLKWPSEKKILGWLEKCRPLERGAERHNIWIEVEQIADHIDPPCFMPIVGPAQWHRLCYKCTVHFTEIAPVAAGDKNKKTLKDDREILYFDRDHLHMLGDTNAAPQREVSKPETEKQ